MKKLVINAGNGSAMILRHRGQISFIHNDMGEVVNAARTLGFERIVVINHNWDDWEALCAYYGRTPYFDFLPRKEKAEVSSGAPTPSMCEDFVRDMFADDSKFPGAPTPNNPYNGVK